MGYIELLFLALTLCLDTFSASISGGLVLRERLRPAQYARIILTFGIFQSGLLAIGWGLGSGLYDVLKLYDHWVAFVILNTLGIKMICDSRSSKETDSKFMNLLDYRNVLLLSLATSIDALAVGLTLSLMSLGICKFFFIILSVFLFTALASYVGIRISKIFSVKSEKYSAVAGGIILICIGFKILIEHLPHSGINF